MHDSFDANELRMLRRCARHLTLSLSPSVSILASPLPSLPRPSPPPLLEHVHQYIVHSTIGPRGVIVFRLYKCLKGTPNV